MVDLDIAPTLDIVSMGVSKLALSYENKQITPLQATRYYLDQIDQFNTQLNAFVHLDHVTALETARASTERWQSSSPLSRYDGIPIALKANIGVAGWPWHAGIKAYDGRMASENAIIANRLQRAGFIFLGLTNMDEGALGASADNPWLGRCLNSVDQNRSPGGSSGGSAVAVAAGLCAAAIGTDTMGSVRIPAAYCGISAHKPSDKLVPTKGLVPLSLSYDSVGALARSSEDVVAIMSVISTASLRTSPYLRSNQPLRIAQLNYTNVINCDRPLETLFEETLSQISQEFGDIPMIDWPSIDIGRLRRKLLLIAEIEAEKTHADMLSAKPDGFSEAFTAMLRFGKSKTADIDQVYQELSVAADHIRDALNDYDIVLMPASPQSAFAFSDKAIPENQADFSVLANVAGLPAAVINMGKTEQGLPAGLQIISRHGEGFKALDFGHAVEKMLDLPLT